MGQKDVYGPMIEEMLTRAGAGGLTSKEIIGSIRQGALPIAPGRQTERIDTGWGIRAALNRLFRKGLIAKIFEVEKDASGKPVERPPRVEINQFGQERTVRVGPMRQYRFYARGFEPKGKINMRLEPLPVEVEKRGKVKVFTAEQRAALQAELLPEQTDVGARGKK